MKNKKDESVSAKDFDEKFERGEDMTAHLDWSKATKRVPLELTLEAIRELDAEAARVGVPRQALIKMWLRDRLDTLKTRKVG